MQSLEPQFIFGDCSQGVVNNVKYNLVQPNSVDLAVNIVFDENLGEATIRRGTTIIGAALHASSNAIQGIFQFTNSSGSISRLLATVDNGSNNVTYYWNGTIWTAGLTTDTRSLPTRFEQFLNYVVRVNGTDSVVSSADGASWTQNTPLDDSNFPNGKFVLVYKDQMTVAGRGSKPDSLFVSSVPNATGTAISWSTGDREIVVNPEDGQNITGLAKIAGLELIFKDRSMFTWNNHSTQADSLVDVGCSSQESVVRCGNVVSFFNPKGVWITTGGQPILISRRIQKWIDGMSASFYDNVGSYGDAEHLYTSLGTCTVDGTSYTGVVSRYSLNTKEWAIFSYAHQFRAFTLFVDSATEKIVGGDSLNTVYQVESSSLTDNTTLISFEIKTHDLVFGSRGILKQISERAMAYGKDVVNGIIQVKIDEKDWITLGVLNKNIEEFLINQTLEGHYFKFRVVGASSTVRGRFLGLELPRVTLLDYSA